MSRVLEPVGSGAGAEVGATLGVAGDEHSGHTVVRIVT